MDDFDNQKLALANFLLPMCPFIHVNGLHKGCELPGFMARADLVLRIGQDPNVMGMPDLELTEEGFSATISVQGARYAISVPWGATCRMWIGEPFVGPIVVWPQSFPADAETPPDGTPTSGGKLRLVTH